MMPPHNPVRPQDQHDPGGRVRLALAEDIRGGAAFSPCGRYRHLLTRDWTPADAPPRAILWIGMNPSTADETVSDPTCNREVIFSRDWGFTRYLKCNMLDWRATKPADLPADPDQACTARNVEVILEQGRTAQMVLLAYGKLHQRYHPRISQTIAALREIHPVLHCLGQNADGSAKHPLYLRKTLTPQVFPR